MVRDDRRLFEFLILEGAQAGLSWETVLRKRARYREVYEGFDPRRVATFGADWIGVAMADPGDVVVVAGTVRDRQKQFGALASADADREMIRRLLAAREDTLLRTSA